jgi:hypothetical protein
VLVCSIPVRLVCAVTGSPAASEAPEPDQSGLACIRKRRADVDFTCCRRRSRVRLLGNWPSCCGIYTTCHPTSGRLQGIEDALYDTSPEDQLSWLHSLHVKVDALLKDIPALKLEVSGTALLPVSSLHVLLAP